METREITEDTPCTKWGYFDHLEGLKWSPVFKRRHQVKFFKWWITYKTELVVDWSK